MLTRAISLACLAGAVVLAPASADAAGRPGKAARLIGIAAAQARAADHPEMDLDPALRRQVLTHDVDRWARSFLEALGTPLSS